MNDRYGPRFVSTLCGILLASGFLLIRISAGWHLYLSYGVLIGITTGGYYVPAASTIARWFIARRSMITGIAVSKIGIGTRTVFIICFSLMAASLFWQVPVRETTFFFLFTIAFGLAYGGNAVSQSPLVTQLFGLRSHGLIFGIVNNGVTIGATIGRVATGALFDLTGVCRTACFVIAALALAGPIISLSLGMPRAGIESRSYPADSGPAPGDEGIENTSLSAKFVMRQVNNP